MPGAVVAQVKRLDRRVVLEAVALLEHQVPQQRRGLSILAGAVVAFIPMHRAAQTAALELSLFAISD